MTEMLYKMYKMSPAEKRLIREQSGMEPTSQSIMRLAMLALVIIVGLALALHLAYLTIANGGALYAAY